MEIITPDRAPSSAVFLLPPWKGTVKAIASGVALTQINSGLTITGSCVYGLIYSDGQLQRVFKTVDGELRDLLERRDNGLNTNPTPFPHQPPLPSCPNQGQVSYHDSGGSKDIRINFISTETLYEGRSLENITYWPRNMSFIETCKCNKNAYIYSYEKSVKFSVCPWCTYKNGSSRSFLMVNLLQRLTNKLLWARDTNQISAWD